MTWPILGALVVTLALAAAVIARRRAELSVIERAASEIAIAKSRGSHRARLQYPSIDLANCIGCALCVKACPEDGVLAMLHGQAAVVHGARCVGHGLCAEACPTGAIALTLGDLSEREDIPALTGELEAKGSPGLFLAGEITGYALIRTAIAHGVSAAGEVAERLPSSRGAGGHDGVTDLLVVGAGPAGIACSLEATRRGIEHLVIDQEEELGGTVSKYPRRKLVMTQPVTLPLHGRLRKTTYVKEELVEMWRELAARHELPLRLGVPFRGLRREADGTYLVQAGEEEIRARSVCLAIGRRGTPRRLGVPGEDLPKVAYHLVDAESYQGRRILVVGGGDSAVEAAVGLSEQPGNEVHLSYRGREFTRIKARNERRLADAIETHRVTVLRESRVARIESDRVHLDVPAEADGAGTVVLENDEVFVLAGGLPPFELLRSSGVSFDPADRDPVVPPAEKGTGLLPALVTSLVLATGTLVFALVHGDYYFLSRAERIGSPLHETLRAAGPVGLSFGALGCLLMIMNVTYLLRRARVGEWIPGSLRSWMIAHLVTGILAYLAILLHSGMDFASSTGGHAFLALTVVVAAGGVGRYLYSFLPRAANGRVMEIDEVRARLAVLSGDWDRAGRGFGEQVQQEVAKLTMDGAWRHSLPRRLAALLTGQRRLRGTLARLREAGRQEDVPESDLRELLALARRAHRASLAAAHYEDLRGLLASWRYVHRWLALFLFLVAGIHIVTAIRYADLAVERVWFLRWLAGVLP